MLVQLIKGVVVLLSIMLVGWMGLTATIFLQLGVIELSKGLRGQGLEMQLVMLNKIK
jgi:hypothetical protein